MITFQNFKPLGNLQRCTLLLVAAVLLTTMSQAAETNLSDTFAIVPVTLGDSDQARVGDRVFVIGAPYGISQLSRLMRPSTLETPVAPCSMKVAS